MATFKTPKWISDPAWIKQCFGDHGLLAGLIRHFKPSPVQIEYAAVVNETIARGGGKTTFLQADTGVGKTLAYLIPALVAAVKSGRRTLVSPYTLEQQRQILKTDGPLAAKLAADAATPLGNQR